MQRIDIYGYTPNIRTVEPAHKVVLALSVVLLCLLLDKPAVGLVAALGMWGLASGWAAVPIRVFGGMLMAESVFLLMAVAGVAVNLGMAPGPGGWGFVMGPWWVGTSHASLDLAWRLAARSLGSAAAMNFLAFTTPLADLLEVMRRLRLPALLIELMALVYRFLFVLLGSLARMRTAQECRLGYSSFRRGMASAGLLAGGLLLDSARRTQRLQMALDSRGGGNLRVLPIPYRYDPRLWAAGTTLLGILLLVWRLT